MNYQNGKGREAQKLTRAQARWLETCLMVLIDQHQDYHGYDFIVLRQDIKDLLLTLTAKSGDRPFCRGCKYWGPKISHTGPDAYGVKHKWTEYPERCTHSEAKEGFCPMEEGDD